MGFTQPWVVEAFAWDLELYGQLQSLAGEELILKGGAAAQLFVPLQRQRASIDVDALCLVEESTLEGILRRVSERFPQESPYFKFKPYLPKAPVLALPMWTYDVLVPSSIGHLWRTEAGEIKAYSLKIDLLHMDSPIEHTRIPDAKTFALDLAFSPNCATSGSLVGDKLLTLATGSIGIPERRMADLPKQIYDLDNLTRFALDEKGVEDAIRTMGTLIPLEASFRGIKVDISKVFTHIKDTLGKFSVVDLRQGDPRFKKYLNDFQSLYIRREARSPLHEWSAKSIRLNLLLDFLRQREEMEPLDVYRTLRRVDEVEHYLRFEDLKGEERGRRRREARQTLIEILEKDTDARQREFQGKPPERVYWQAVNLRTLGEIEEKILQI